MKNIDRELESLKDIMLLYANMPPHPLENLRKIKDAFQEVAGFDAKCPDAVLPVYTYFGFEELNHRIDVMIKIQEIGLKDAADICRNEEEKNILLAQMFPNYYKDPYPPDGERGRTMYNAAFCAVYGYSVGDCPCSDIREEILEKEGFLWVARGKGVDEARRLHIEPNVLKPRWIKSRLNCLQCDHLHFVSILKNLSDGKNKAAFRYMPEMVSGYGRESKSEGAMFWTNKDKNRVELGKITMGKGPYLENPGAFPEYMNGLPCNVLVDFLSSDFDNTKKIKQCPICEKYFIAANSRREICYSKECGKKEEKYKKQWQREQCPEKYGSSDPKQKASDEAYERRKQKWEIKAKSAN